MAGVTQAVGEALAPSTAVGGRALTLPRLWAFTSVALPVVASLEASMSSVDLAYQIRAGNLMLFTHHLLRHDTFTFTAAGRAWTDQQWGAQIAFALIWRAGGWAALALLRFAAGHAHLRLGGLFGRSFSWESTRNMCRPSPPHRGETWVR